MTLTDVFVSALRDGFVAPRILTDSGGRLDNPQTELPTLHTLVNRDVMADTPKVANRLLLQEYRANANDGVCLAQNSDRRHGVVGVRTSRSAHSS